MARKTKEDSQKTREALLDAAEQLFLNKGVSKTTLDDIAKAAAVTRGAVYWHFENKGRLFTALCDRAKAQMPPLSELDVSAGDDPLATLLDFHVAGMTHFFQSSPLLNLVKILHQQYEIDEECKTLFIEFNNHMARSLDETAQYLKAARARLGSPLSDSDALDAAMALKAYHIGLIECYLISPETIDLPRRTRRLLTWFFKGLYPRD